MQTLLNQFNILLTVDPCATVLCANGYICKLDETTRRPFCDPSCEINNGGCQVDEECRLIQVECFTDPCPPVIECVAQQTGKA